MNCCIQNPPISLSAIFKMFVILLYLMLTRCWPHRAVFICVRLLLLSMSSVWMKKAYRQNSYSINVPVEGPTTEGVGSRNRQLYLTREVKKEYLKGVCWAIYCLIFIPTPKYPNLPTYKYHFMQTILRCMTDSYYISNICVCELNPYLFVL